MIKDRIGKRKNNVKKRLELAERCIVDMNAKARKP